MELRCDGPILLEGHPNSEPFGTSRRSRAVAKPTNGTACSSRPPTCRFPLSLRGPIWRHAQGRRATDRIGPPLSASRVVHRTQRSHLLRADSQPLARNDNADPSPRLGRFRATRQRSHICRQPHQISARWCACMTFVDMIDFLLAPNYLWLRRYQCAFVRF